MKASLAENHSTYIDTPRGIFTAAGTWFHTTEDALKEYAGPLIERVPISRLIASAESWFRSPGVVIIWATPFLLWNTGLLLTTLADVFLFLLFALWGPLLANQWALPLLRILENVLAQAMLYVASMSFFALGGRFDLMAFGLVLFILVRWGLIEKAFNLSLDPMRKRLYQFPYADQVLKSVMVRAALKHRVSLPELDRMERFIMNNLHQND
jgi:hypothetical protein